jgi:hypothetical protein
VRRRAHDSSGFATSASALRLPFWPRGDCSRALITLVLLVGVPFLPACGGSDGGSKDASSKNGDPLCVRHPPGRTEGVDRDGWGEIMKAATTSRASNYAGSKAPSSSYPPPRTCTAARTRHANGTAGRVSRSASRSSRRRARNRHAPRARADGETAHPARLDLPCHSGTGSPVEALLMSRSPRGSLGMA